MIKPVSWSHSGVSKLLYLERGRRHFAEPWKQIFAFAFSIHNLLYLLSLHILISYCIHILRFAYLTFLFQSFKFGIFTQIFLNPIHPPLGFPNLGISIGIIAWCYFYLFLRLNRLEHDIPTKFTFRGAFNNTTSIF